MNKHKSIVLYILFTFTFLLSPFLLLNVAGQKKFTVVIDAGHGGKDPGAVGASSHEKDVNLAIALKLGEKITKQNPEVKVLYTRKEDVFLDLAARPKFANDNHADLFISIHTNSADNKTASGIETFTLGVARTKEHLAVAMKENSVILLEDNHEQKYQGFNPNSVESYIMFEFMQDKFMEQSINLASLVQTQSILHTKRYDRGVRQAGFLVLKNAAMPSILVEVGFLSNKEEEKYLNSTEGQDALATAIYNGFAAYKRNYDKKSSPVTASNNNSNNNTSNTRNTSNANTKDGTVFKVQIFTARDFMRYTDPRFKGLEVSHYRESGAYKYTYGETTDYEKALEYRQEARKHFKEAFIVSFDANGNRIK